jgi:hypothetical protein
MLRRTANQIQERPAHEPGWISRLRERARTDRHPARRAWLKSILAQRDGTKAVCQNSDKPRMSDYHLGDNGRGQR